MKKKAQGLSFNTLIIAAIALLVLVVLSVMFTQRIGGFSKGLDSCRGECKDPTECKKIGFVAPEGHQDCDPGWTPTSTGGVERSLSDQQVCCLLTK